MERLLILATSAFVFLCLGVALVILASSPGKRPPNSGGAPIAVQEAPRPNAGDAAAQKQLDDLIAGAPDYARFFARLREVFPGDYAAAMAAFKARLLAGGRVESVDYYVSEAVRQLRQSRGVLVAKAEPEALARIFDAQLAVMRAVAREDPRLCVGFLYGSSAQDFVRVAAARRPLVAEMALARLEATADGQAKKIERDGPSESDVKSLETALAADGLDATEIDVLIGGKMPDPPLEDARMCAAGQKYLVALRALPEAARSRIYSLLLGQMARS